ncbi:hypothetical protein G6F40_017147 [Rhizopus arrhizus]|nr:hypothetical protein G6F40_017147 [Rhizopus arrhizus]
MPCQGSPFSRFARASALVIGNASAAVTFASSSQRNGTATPAFSRARNDHEHTLVAPRVLRSQSMKITPLRFALLIVAT